MKKIIQNMGFIIIISSFILTAEVFAQLEGNPENFCRSGFFTRDSKSYRFERIIGKKGEKVYFYGDERKDCPQNKNCRLKSYVLPDDEVIVSRYFGEFACVWFQPKKGSETVGWIPLKNIEESYGTRTIGADEWLGKWSFHDNSIVIAKTGKPDIFKITGDAAWKGLGDNVHIGELDGTAKLLRGDLEYGLEDRDEFACQVTMRIVGKFLVVSDNLNCGGANVTFSGVYQRKAKK